VSGLHRQVEALVSKLDALEAQSAQRAAAVQSRLAEQGEAISDLQQQQALMAPSLSAAVKEQGDRLDQRLQGIQALISRGGGAPPPPPPPGEVTQRRPDPTTDEGEIRTYKTAGHRLINYAMQNQPREGAVVAIADLVRQASAAARGAQEMRATGPNEPEVGPVLAKLGEGMKQVVQAAYLEVGRRVPRELLTAVADETSADHAAGVTRAIEAIGRGAEPVRDSLETAARTITAEVLRDAIALRDHERMTPESFGEVLNLLQVQPMPAPTGTPYSPRHHDPLGSRPDGAGELVVERQVTPGYAWRNQVLVLAQVTLRPAGGTETGAQQ